MVRCTELLYGAVGYVRVLQYRIVQSVPSVGSARRVCSDVLVDINMPYSKVDTALGSW